MTFITYNVMKHGKVVSRKELAGEDEDKTSKDMKDPKLNR